MKPNQKFDVAIIGAGVIGCSVAYYLCQCGITNIILIEKETFPGTGSTSKAFGGIRAQFTTAANIRMSLLSMKLLEKMDDEMQSQAGYVRAGYLFVTAEKSNFEQLQQLMAFQKSLGADVEPITVAEIRQRFPYVRADDLLGGSFGKRDGFIDPGGLTNAFYTRALSRGARALVDTRVTGLQKSSARITGVETDKGVIQAEYVVNAAGPYAAEIARYAGLDLPVQPVRTNIAVSGPTPDWPRLIPMTIDLDTRLVIRREGEGVGFAWSDPNEPPGFLSQFNPDYIEQIAPKIERRYPNLMEAGINFSKCWAGLYPETPDHHAILGESGIPGFLLAVGLGGHGIMHSPSVGCAISELIATGKVTSVDVSPFRLKRIESGELNLEGAVL
jgi:sarcosine oxidase subunit beta